MKKRKKNKTSSRILIVIVIIGVLVVAVFFQNRKNLQVVSVVEEISDYSYYLESNATKIYKKYYKQLEYELSDNKIDEENYASLVGKLFLIDYYTLNNKVTNKDIGGIQFIHSNLKDSFIEKSSNTVYKYIKNNLFNNRKQDLPEVRDVNIIEIENIKYDNKEYKDDSGYKVKLEINYIKDYGYPNQVTLIMIHENNKIVIVEIK